jgi:hypothetical protein|tara:strand:- start:31225 stop:31617 length:393 start_codon:yes stop_codon:yes gene_type:complete
MSDGRHFTSYEPNNALNSKVRYELGLATGSEYRKYLTQNAIKLMNENSKVAWKENGCGPCKNLCLGIDETNRPGNSTEFDQKSCIPPDNFLQYTGEDGTTYPMYQPEFTRPAVPSGAILSKDPKRTFYDS